MKKRFTALLVLIIFITMSFILPLTAFAEVPMNTDPASPRIYSVQAGDSLWLIAKKCATTVDELRRLNNLTTDVIKIGQVLIVSNNSNAMYIKYAVRTGDTLSSIAERFGTTIQFIKTLNGFVTESVYTGQIIKLLVNYRTYKVVSGDTLWGISVKMGTTVNDIMIFSGLTTTLIFPGEILRMPATIPTPKPAPAPSPGQTVPTVTYRDYIVQAGDTGWSLAVKYGIPMQELLTVNKLSPDSVFNIGQKILIPVHTIPIKPTPGPEFGEYLDWWTEAQYVVPIGSVFKVVDFATKRSYMVKRSIGANHADNEPLTPADAAIIKEVWGGSYTWITRAVIVEINGRRIAASMTSMPHGVEYLLDNDFPGHFDIHFFNSTRHVDGKIDPLHQAQIKIAAGITQ